MFITRLKSIFQIYLDFSMLLAIEVFLFLCLKDSFPFITLFLLTVFWYLRTKDYSFIGIVFLLGILLIPRYEKVTDMIIGKVIEVHASYSVLENGNQKLLVYTEEPLQFDAEYAITENIQELEGTSGFFRFDFVTYCKNRGIFASTSMDDPQLVQEHFSFRSLLQKRIQSLKDENLKLWCNRLLLNISDKENTLDSWVFEQGFSYTAVLVCLDSILKYFIEKKNRNKILLVLNVVLLFLYHFPMLLVQSLIFRLLSYTNLHPTKKQGVGMTLTMLVFPYAYNRVSFLIPAIYRLSHIHHENASWKSYFGILCIQSIFYQKMNFIQSFLYPIIRNWIGFGWTLALIHLLCPSLPFISIYEKVSYLLNGIRYFDIPGSMIGFGFPFFVYVLFSIRKWKSFWIICFLLLMGFQITGLFHPFAEITFINIGQGDSILIRMPLNKGNVLIDTGKPSQWNTVDTFLQAKGIQNIDTFIITHPDDDHSGNQESILKEYNPEMIITNHFDSLYCIGLTILDLNTIENEDENQSSIVCYLNLNGLKILLMGDADKTTEEMIIDKYGNLQTDILKLSHHGSNTGTSDTFLNTIQPKLGIISCGSYALYHHPSLETIQRLLSRHIPYFITREVGDISIFCIGPFNILLTSSLQFAIL